MQAKHNAKFLSGTTIVKKLSRQAKTQAKVGTDPIHAIQVELKIRY